MKIETLGNISLSQLTDCFNVAYADYMVPMKLTEAQMQGHIISRRVDLDFSAGAFEDGKLKGFILMGLGMSEGRMISYNAGTGVVPDARGRGLTKAMYRFLLPLLKANGVLINRLEVIEANQRALHVYRSLGYQVKRMFLCFKGTLREKDINKDYQVERLTIYDFGKLSSFWDWDPSWQHDISSVESRMVHNISLGISHQQELKGYLIYDPDTKRVQQFAIHPDHRRKGLATLLFHTISQQYTPEIMVINVEEGSMASAAFLEAMGLECFVRQYEMELQLI